MDALILVVHIVISLLLVGLILIQHLAAVAVAAVGLLQACSGVRALHLS
jgi:preprotein translocase subunit SecG